MTSVVNNWIIAIIQNRYLLKIDKHVSHQDYTQKLFSFYTFTVIQSKSKSKLLSYNYTFNSKFAISLQRQSRGIVNIRLVCFNLNKYSLLIWHTSQSIPQLLHYTLFYRSCIFLRCRRPVDRLGLGQSSKTGST